MRTQFFAPSTHRPDWLANNESENPIAQMASSPPPQTLHVESDQATSAWLRKLPMQLNTQNRFVPDFVRVSPKASDIQQLGQCVPALRLTEEHVVCLVYLAKSLKKQKELAVSNIDRYYRIFWCAMCMSAWKCSNLEKCYYRKLLNSILNMYHQTLVSYCFIFKIYFTSEIPERFQNKTNQVLTSCRDVEVSCVYYFLYHWKWGEYWTSNYKLKVF